MTSASEGQPRHVNAVVIDTATDTDAVENVRSLTRCCSVLVTKGTDLDGLPIQGAPLDESDIAGLVTETETQQEVIAAAVAEHKRRTRSSSLKAPSFPTTPNPADHVPVEDTASGRAFAAANYLAAAWTAWLQTDEERRRRTTRPQTGETPWIMPEHMNSPQLARFPESFAARVHEQPLV
ncbi:hypothetical protein [Nocardioides iriomotensis]|uniref:hypothetical protein n=1 Tax=Nocardioides iriomotensis TaxID=715784 RepID=UPI0010213879|nr:hypothetical protein [Nocardioides iriomotensis]